MTFKHVKFEDSPTMRALEKVAQEKGLVKQEPLQKKASVPKRPDYTPSSNLMENVLKLCAGLRTQGLVKEAAELETNYLNYKSAQSLYEAHKEKGEDLIHAAHPQGSHKLEDVAGDEAVVEDILDQHMKHIQMVEKKPTGKLSSTAQVISEVKRALGQGAPQETEEEVIQKKENFLNAMPREFGGIVQRVTTYGDSEWANIDKGKINEKSAKVNSVLGVRPFNRAQLNILKGAFGDFINWASDTGAFEDSVWHSGAHNEESKNRWNQYVGGYASSFRGKIDVLDRLLSKQESIQIGREQGTYAPPKKQEPLTIAPVEIKEGALGPIHRQINSLKQQLSTWTTYRSISSDPQATNWIKEEIASLDDIKARMDKVPEDDNAEVEAAPNFQRELAEEQKSIAEFKAGWVDQK